jgi:hypothetical protein
MVRNIPNLIAVKIMAESPPGKPLTEGRDDLIQIGDGG